MTKLDFKTRKELFQSGPIQRHKNFKRFEREAALKRRREFLMKVAVAVGILTLLMFLIFRVSAKEQGSLKDHPERTMEVLVDKL